VIYPVGVIAALLLGTGYVLQQRVAATLPLDEILHFRLLFDLMRRPLWWVGMGAMIVGQLLSGLALQLANVALVEPLLSTNLLFALAIAALVSRQRPRLTEMGGAVLLSAALGIFIGVGDPHGSDDPYPPIPIVWLAVASVATAAAICVVMGKRQGLVGEAIWLAGGAGLLFGLQDAATRATIVQYDRHGFASVFVHVWVYLVLASAVVGILLAQSAFKAARLDYSLPPITAAEPIVGILLGICLLGDKVSVTIPGLALESACLLALIAGVAMIGRSPGLAAACEVPDAGGHAGPRGGAAAKPTHPPIPSPVPVPAPVPVRLERVTSRRVPPSSAP
jgi:drug/metabolite transporter (DMT)-like permease